MVLDFQSLYPSVIISHNYCFSTCLGRLPPTAAAAAPVVAGAGSGSGSGGSSAPVGVEGSEEGSSEVRLGGSVVDRPLRLLQQLQESLVLSANGVIYVSAAEREGVLPRMLAEVLSTRVMVKQALKDPRVANDKALYNKLNARQFGLKLLSNVTYGYTAAGFSGRMPCAELADAIVGTARKVGELKVDLKRRR